MSCQSISEEIIFFFCSVLSDLHFWGVYQNLAVPAKYSSLGLVKGCSAVFSCLQLPFFHSHLQFSTGAGQPDAKVSQVQLGRNRCLHKPTKGTRDGVEAKARYFEPERLFFLCPRLPPTATQIQSRAKEVCASVAEVEVVARRKTQEKKSPLACFWSRREVRSDGSFIGPDWSETQSIGFRV